MNNNYISILIILCSSAFNFACDPNRYKKCEWYLDPDNHNRYAVKEGQVPLCVRNYETRKQKCFIVADLSYAKKLQGKAFKYRDLELDRSMPRKIKNLKLCEKKSTDN